MSRMINVSYYKDYSHNYLIMEGENQRTELYQCRMITDNQIEGLLPCKERHVNGDVFLYYEITSKQNLLNLYEGRKLTMKQLKNIFIHLKMVQEKLSKFLLNERNLVLQPEYIYADAETEHLYFLYYPFETEDNYIVSFLEYLAEKIDNEDQTAVEIVYKMLELATKEQFVLDEVVNWFEEDLEWEEKVNERIPERENPLSLLEPPEEEEEEKIGNKWAVIFMIAAIMLFLILFFMNRFYLFSEKIQVCLYAGLLFCGALFLGNAGFFIYDLFLSGKREDGGIKERFRKTEREEEKPYRETDISDRIQQKAEQAYGNTVFIPWVENCENKLYGVGKGNKNHIDLGKLPLTVGKLAGSVDMVIEDQSISRRHARFFREGNRIYMSDLNSTNGSFKNGMRLLPNASEVLEPGDEIRLGKLKFIYR